MNQNGGRRTDYASTMKRLDDAVTAFDAAYRRIASENGLTYNQLMLVYLISDRGSATQSEACDYLCVAKSSMHCTLAGMMRMGLLRLEKGRNRKEKNIVPTEKGRILIAKAVAETEAIRSSALANVGEGVVEAFVDTAERLSSLMTETTERFYTTGSARDRDQNRQLSWLMADTYI